MSREGLIQTQFNHVKDGARPPTGLTRTTALCIVLKTVFGIQRKLPECPCSTRLRVKISGRMQIANLGRSMAGPTACYDHGNNTGAGAESASQNSRGRTVGGNEADLRQSKWAHGDAKPRLGAFVRGLHPRTPSMPLLMSRLALRPIGQKRTASSDSLLSPKTPATGNRWEMRLDSLGFST